MGTLAQTLSTPLGVVEWFVYLISAVIFAERSRIAEQPCA